MVHVERSCGQEGTLLYSTEGRSRLETYTGKTPCISLKLWTLMQLIWGRTQDMKMRGHRISLQESQD